jgi:CubicO group peptidase (beta-lactamase class C family)
MKRFCSLVLGSLLAVGQAGAATAAGPDAAPGAAQEKQFAASLQTLSRALTIPGVAFAVIRDGEVVSQGQVNANPDAAALTLDTPLRFASVTKALTAVALMRAVDRGALSLDDSAAQWLPEFADRPQITVRQLAAHVSEGTPGTEYVYATQRYAKLAFILEKATKTGFEELLRKEILTPLRMSWHDSPDLGAHAGLVTTVKDMTLFVQALQRNTLLSQRRFDEMVAPYQVKAGPAPVGVGFFTQQIGNARVVWSFGQDDPDHSSALVLMLPKRKLALVMLANTDELSNPFRLLMGDVRYSPFATAFLDAYAPEITKGITERERTAQGTLIAIWNQEQDKATEQFRRFKTLGTPRSDDLVPHFMATMVGDTESREFMESLDRTVVAAHPGNRWVMLMSGGLNERLGQSDAAAARYKTILALPNQEQDGLAKLFQAWSYGGLARVYQASDRPLALKYVDQGLATGVTGGTREDLERLRKAME